jgi:hypothetical protein
MPDSISPLLRASPHELAGAVRQAALAPGRRESDPVLVALLWETRQFMHGACALLASHLCETRGFAPLLLEGRPPGQAWMTRHAAACGNDGGRAEGLARDGRGLDAEILDAAGGGTLRERLGLYREPGWEYRAVLGRDEGCRSRWMWLPNPDRPPGGAEGDLPGLPALAVRLGVPVDLPGTLSRVLSAPEFARTPGAEAVLASGLSEWCGLGEGPPATPWR